MKNQIYIRMMKSSDLPVVKSIVDDNHMFPSEYLNDMTQPFLHNENEERWYVAHKEDSSVVAVAYCAPERMTEGAWNLLLIAVFKQYQGMGFGSKLMGFIEDELSSQQARILLVETSGLPEYKLTRDFYPKCGYDLVATIPEYYDKGDDKVVFWKSLVN